MTQQEPKFIKGDGMTTPDLKLFAGAYLAVTYWQADPDNNQQPTIYINNDRQPNEAGLILRPNQVGPLADVLKFVDEQVG